MLKINRDITVKLSVKGNLLILKGHILSKKLTYITPVFFYDQKVLPLVFEAPLH